jgi:hypothetical protein
VYEATYLNSKSYVIRAIVRIITDNETSPRAAKRPFLALLASAGFAPFLPNI